MPHLKSSTRGMILAKAKQQQMLLTTKLCTRFLFLQPRSAVFHRKFNWNVKASDTNQRDKEKNGGAIHTIGVWSCFPYVVISTGFCMCTIIKLHITIASARCAFVWPQEFCVYLNCMIKKQGLQLVENFVDWQKEREWELFEQKRHLVYIVNPTTCTLLNWTVWFRCLGTG